MFSNTFRAIFIFTLSRAAVKERQLSIIDDAVAPFEQGKAASSVVVTGTCPSNEAQAGTLGINMIDWVLDNRQQG